MMRASAGVEVEIFPRQRLLIFGHAAVELVAQRLGRAFKLAQMHFVRIGDSDHGLLLFDRRLEIGDARGRDL